MTRHELRLAAVLGRELGDDVPERVVLRLIELGLADMRALERCVLRHELARLQRCGIPRCEAMHAVAYACGCSYERVRKAFYETANNPKKPKK